MEWEYQCLFGFKHRWIAVVGDLRIVVEKVDGHLADWIAYDVDSWDIVHRSFYEDETHFATVEAAQKGAELWLDSVS